MAISITVSIEHDLLMAIFNPLCGSMSCLKRTSAIKIPTMKLKMISISHLVLSTKFTLSVVRKDK